MTSSSGRPIVILLIEDNPGDIFLTKKAFADGKILNKLHVAKDGSIALAMLRKEAPYQDMETPDLILLDINLPKVDGREVLEAIKPDPVLRSIPVIVLSSSDAEKDILDMYNLHANSYITKPVDIKSFSDIASTIEDFWVGIVKLPTRTKQP